MDPQPLIAVRDVGATSAWYQAVLGLVSGHGGSEYEQLPSEGRMVMQLHRWDAHEHRFLGNPGQPPGNGVLLWFRADHFDDVLERVRAHNATVLEGPKVNPNATPRNLAARPERLCCGCRQPVRRPARLTGSRFLLMTARKGTCPASC